MVLNKTIRSGVSFSDEMRSAQRFEIEIGKHTCCLLNALENIFSGSKNVMQHLDVERYFGRH